MDRRAREKQDRIVAARMALKARFEEKICQTPALSDSTPQGTGSFNRHGMPKLPIGQNEAKQWPVLDLGVHPDMAREDWELVIDGPCQNPIRLNWKDLLEMEQVTDISDFHCVTTWSRMDLEWKGVLFADLMALVRPHENATHVMCHGYDHYTTNIPLEEAMKPDVLIVHTVDGQALPREHGGPVRMITPQLYAWKGAKWISRIELMTEDRPGYWEQRGYSMTAHPWRNDRYS